MLSHVTRLTATLATLAVATPALAQEDSGVRLGLRTGYGLPLGSVGQLRLADTMTQDDALGDIYSGQLPLWFDLGYRVNDALVLGIYASYAHAFIADSRPDSSAGCPEGADCTGRVIRLGAQGEYALTAGPTRPWLGLGLGYEIATASLDAVFYSGSTQASGFEGLLQGGVDFALSPSFGLGPMAILSLAQYSRCSAELNSTERSCDVEDSAPHGWLVLGLRGAFDF